MRRISCVSSEELSRWRKLTYGFVVVLAVVLLAEGGVRLLGQDRLIPGGAQPFPTARHLSTWLLYDKALGWRLRPGFDDRMRRHNDLGLNNDMVTPTPVSGAYRILCLGDSCTYGIGVPVDQAYPRVLEHALRLELQLPGVEVVNAGVPGYSSYQGLIAFEQHYRELQPDVVLIAYGWNDLAHAQSGREDDDYLPGPQPSWTARLLSRSLLLSCVGIWVHRWRSVEDKGAGRSPRLRPARSERYLRRLLDVVRRAKALPVFVTLPARGDHPEHRRQMDLVRRLADEEQTMLLDGARLATGPGDFLRVDDPMHLSTAGYRKLGLALAEKLAAQLRRHNHGG